ncbi:MAG: VWA domain-containing protein, partial [Bacteroidota bacterium]
MKTWLGIDLFANPEALLLLTLIPAYLFWYARYYRRQRLVIRLSYDPVKLKKPTLDLAMLRHLPRALQLMAIAMLVIAIARPQAADEVSQRKAEGIDIVIALDVSGSMEADDFAPNRLEVAKRNAKAFIQGRNSDQIGLVLFASEALSYAPISLDHAFLERLVDDVDFGMLPRQGTAMGNAIATSINRLGSGSNPSQVIILLTDGANNQGEIDPISAAKLAREKNIRIYSIGIGRELYQLVSGGNTESDLDEATLKRIADITSGKFYRATAPERLKSIFEEISQLETGQVQDLSYRIVQDRYPIF